MIQNRFCNRSKYQPEMLCSRSYAYALCKCPLFAYAKLEMAKWWSQHSLSFFARVICFGPHIYAIIKLKMIHKKLTTVYKQPEADRAIAVDIWSNDRISSVIWRLDLNKMNFSIAYTFRSINDSQTLPSIVHHSACKLKSYTKRLSRMVIIY